jgi:hypothetical protein
VEEDRAVRWTGRLRDDRAADSWRTGRRRKDRTAGGTGQPGRTRRPGKDRSGQVACRDRTGRTGKDRSGPSSMAG